MRTYINGIQMRGFKSFNRPTTIEFGPGLNCIVGPNGSGKSNILDGVCFVLGRLSTKSIRAENYSDLLHKQKAQRARDGEVIFHLDNSSNIFPVQGNKIEIRRRITPKGSTVYYINRKRATRRQIIELLSMSRVTPEGHNIILQGDVNNFINLSSIDKRKIVEEIAGIHVYEMKKEDALNELKKVDEKLREASIVLTEKKANLNSLEEEKRTAEKYRSYDNELKRAKATEILLRIKRLDRKKQEIGGKFDKVEGAHQKIHNKIAASEKKVEVLHSKISEIEKKIEKKGGEDQLDLQKQVENLKLDIESSKQLIASSKKELDRIDSRKSNLKERLNELSKKISDSEKEKKETEEEQYRLKKKLTSIDAESGASEENINKLEKELEEKESAVNKLKQNKLDMQENLQKISSELEVLDYKSQSLEEKVEQAEELESKAKNLGKDKNTYRELIQEINNLTTKDSKFAVELNELRRRISQKEEVVAQLRVDANSTQELFRRDNAISTILKSKRDIPGIVGTVAGLGNVGSKYSKALGVAAGLKLKNLVVKDENTAIKCLGKLKQTKSGVATFLPLTKLNPPDTSKIKPKLSAQGVIGLASELVSCKPEHKIVFQHIFRDTIIIKDTSVAKKLGIGRYNMVSLDGDIFSRTGAITGGFRRAGGVKFSDKDMSAKLDYELSELSKLKKELKEKESERGKLEDKIIKFRGEKAELEAKISSAGESKLDLNSLNKELEELNKRNKELKEKQKTVEKELSEIDGKIEKAIVEKNATGMKIRKFKFGKKSTEVRELESKVAQLDSKIISTEATIENVLLPEKKNISRVILSLDKEKKEFQEQIKLNEDGIKRKKKVLDRKEKEERKYYGELKSLFADKNKHQEVMGKEEERIKELRREITEDEEERNSLSIAKAKIEAESEALQEEIEPYREMKPLQYLTSATAAKKKQEELDQKIEELGSVNMRALEIYETVRKEFDNLSWRVEKLGSEKESVVKVINEIEHKKHDSFMQTYNQLNEHFKNLFSRITDRHTATLALENQDNPFEGGIRINVKDAHGKRIYLGSLSGGEKTLVAIAFLLSVQEFNPAPFYLLDEIDAALDKVNSEKVAKLLEEYSKKAQVIIISHNDAVITLADNLYGIWMNKQGESYINALKI